MGRLRILLYAAALGMPAGLGAQTAAPLFNQILERLERLERENRALAEEVHALRAELAAHVPAPVVAPPATEASESAAAEAPGPAGVPERLDIAERRIEEQAQTKVETAQKFPLRLTGFALFNAFSNSRDNADTDYPGIANAAAARRAGATFRQTTIGLDFRGPLTVLGGKVSGNVYMDFFGTPGTALNETMRLRTGSVQIDWASRSIMAGLEKPIFNPRDPSSLARVGVSPLTGAGNLWLWVPQVRFQQDLKFSAASGLNAQVGVIQTREAGPYNDTTVATERSRPGWEGRFNWFYRIDEDRRIEFAPGFHVSQSHAGGFSIPSRVYQVDWLIRPARAVEFTGVFYTGENVTHLGTGASRQSFYLTRGEADPVHSMGGWGQLTFRPANRVALHLFNGHMDDRNSDLIRGALGKTLVYGGNIYYSLAPNVIVAIEATQTRSTYIGTGLRHNNHYDLALAYLF